MQFRHPEILYFLSLLIIPVIVHLFQLRRFKKQQFTNVKLLEELSIQTRKSSKIKKWLLLSTRLLLLAAAIIAFAQPYFNSKESFSKNSELYILLDNSFSMQAKGEKGELLRRAVEDLLVSVPEDAQFSLLTADAQYWNTDIKAIAKDLQQLNYSNQPFDLGNLSAKIKAHQPRGEKEIIVISDGVGISKTANFLPKEWNSKWVISEAQKKNNVWIDSVYLKQTLDNFYEIGILLEKNHDNEVEIPLSLNNNGKLLAKSVVPMKATSKLVELMIPRADFNGSATIEDQGIPYDDSYYFSLSAPQKIKVFAIGSSTDNQFLSRIYTGEEFEFKQQELPQLDYSQLPKQDVILLNNLAEIPDALSKNLKEFYDKGGNVILIPSNESNAKSLTQFASQFGRVAYSETAAKEKLITKIAYEHPLFAEVFEKKTDNFQYPKSNTNFALQTGSAAVIGFEDQSAFLTATSNGWSHFYAFGGPIDKAHSNFSLSPLVVPTFYNMGRNMQRSGIVAFEIGKNSSYLTEANLGKETVLKVSNQKESFIPLQQVLQEKVKLNFIDAPENAGNFQIENQGKIVDQISFNFTRNESQLQTDDLSAFKTTEQVETIFDQWKSDRSETDLWKIFAALALLFILIELLIQKFVK